jgi:tricorn protease
MALFIITMRILSRFFILLFPITCGLLPIASAQKLPDTTRLLRFPTTNGAQIVFCYAGELYTVGKDGGIARRLSSGPGYTSFPHFSADGTQLAFTSQYDGNTEVYVMPGEGGTPKRLTTSATLHRDDISDRMGPNNLVMTWENTKPLIVFRSRMQSFNDFIGQLFTVGLEAELPQQMPVPRGGFASFSPDDSKMAFNRVFREFRTWKHYRGGMADDVWIYVFKTGTTENLTNNPAQDICPMWGPDNKIYFSSDRDGRMNLFSIDLASKETKQLTTFKDFDIKFPSIGKNRLSSNRRVTFGGTIWRGRRRRSQSTSRRISSGRSAFIDASKTFNRSAPRRMLSASSWSRAGTFSVPMKAGTARNSPDLQSHARRGCLVAGRQMDRLQLDATGENELYVRSQDGKGQPQQITNADIIIIASWSPGQ